VETKDDLYDSCSNERWRAINICNASVTEIADKGIFAVPLCQSINALWQK
jgi:hypothetical protein